MKRFLTPLLVLVVTFSVSATAYAHYIWITVENRQARFALLEDPNESPSAEFSKYVTTLQPQSGGSPLRLGSAKEGARYASLSASQTVVVVDSVLGVKDITGVPYLPIYHSIGAASLADAGVDAKQPYEVLARRTGNDLVVSVLEHGKPVSGAEVWVQWHGVEDKPKSVKSDASGSVVSPWPAKTSPGFVGVRALIIESKPGEAEGKKYTEVHHWAILTFPVGTMQTAALRKNAP